MAKIGLECSQVEKKNVDCWSTIKTLQLSIAYPFTGLSKLILSLLLSYFIHKLYRPNSVCTEMAQLELLSSLLELLSQ